LNIEPTGQVETSVRNYQATLRNVPQEGVPHLHRSWSLKSRATHGCHWSYKDCFKEGAKRNKMQRPSHSEPHRKYSKDNSVGTTKVIGMKIEDVPGKE